MAVEWQDHFSRKCFITQITVAIYYPIQTDFHRKLHTAPYKPSSPRSIPWNKFVTLNVTTNFYPITCHEGPKVGEAVWSMRHGMSPTILFTRICVPHTFARYSRKGSLNIAQPSLHTLTPSSNHYYGQCSTEDSNDDGRLTGCTKEAPLDAFLDHRQP